MRKVKLTWADQLRFKVKNVEGISSRNQIEHKSIEARIQKKSITNNSNPLDYYDSYILEKALYNLKIESENLSLRLKNGKKDQKREVEFHEQYFS